MLVPNSRKRANCEIFIRAKARKIRANARDVFAQMRELIRANARVDSRKFAKM